MIYNIVISEQINSDINRLQEYYNNATRKESKEQLRQKLIFTKLKKISIQTESEYLKDLYIVIQDENISSVTKVLNTLNEIKDDIYSESKVDILIYKALLLELLGEDKEASVEYKKALHISFNRELSIMYREFIERRLRSVKDNSCNTPLKADTLRSKAKALEAAAKLANDSHKKREYFLEAIGIYKKMMDLDSKYNREYILALIKSVETYKLDKKYLVEAQMLIFHMCDCKDTELYLLNKIKSLKEVS